MSLALLSPLLSAPLVVRAKSAITVNSNGDGVDADGSDCTCDTVGVGTVCTLRAAMETANACSGADTILFAADYTIAPATALPDLTDAGGGTTIAAKGRSIVINGAGVAADMGLVLASDGNAISGLRIQSFGMHNVAIYGDNNTVGTDGDGGSDAQERNVITLSGQYGIYVQGDNNTIAGNYIGVAANGTDKAANGFGGVSVGQGSGNVIGTDGDGVSDELERNVIASSSPTGVAVSVNTSSAPGGTRIAGNYIGTNAAGDTALPDQFMGVYVGYNVVGTIIGTNGDGQGDAAERNVISGIAMSGAGGAVKIRSATVVAGNYIGLNAAGTAAVANFYGIMMDVANDSRIGTNADGVSDALERNVIAGSTNSGAALTANGDCRVVVAGNYFGTNAAGTAALPNAVGLRFSGAHNWQIGGFTATERNVISGNSAGIVAYGSLTGTQVVGNHVGVAADGVTPLPNSSYGIWLRDGATGLSIGSLLPGGANTIANNGVGIYTDNADTIAGNAIRGNSIHGNTGLGIDLYTGATGVTANDAGDGDTGPNGLQNYPVLTGALTAADGSSSLILGSLNSTASGTFTLDFYSNDACDASGNGEGQTYLGATTVTADGGGNATFLAPLLVSAPIGGFVTATATDAQGSTSEFSACFAATAAAAGAPAGVSVGGPTTGFPSIAYSYSAGVSMGGATFPLTITWHATDQAAVARTITSATDVQAITWASTGAKTVAVTVHNSSGSVAGSHAFTARATSDNSAPQAAGGNLACASGGAVSGSLAATDANGDVLTYAIVANGSKGTATITDAATGAYTYVPNPGATGSDSFTFRASDGAANSNVATVTVTIDVLRVYVPMAIHRRR